MATAIEGHCVVCGKWFSRSSRSQSAGLCCSRDCGFVLFAWRGEQSRKLTKAKREFAKWSKPRLISEFSRLATLRRMKDRASSACKVCGKPVGWARVRTYPATTCSQDCNKRTEVAKANKRTSRIKRKAKKRAVTVEAVNPIKVFARDGWRCHLCGGMTNKAKRGTLHPNAPELDHIVPLSKGGEHSYANTACAHKRCNAAKSDAIMGQPSLLAA